MEGFLRVRWGVFRLLLAVLVGFSATAAWAERVEDLPKPTDYVSDLAHVLSPEAIARLDRLCTQLDHSSANAQVAVVTINTLDGADMAQFANDLYHRWGIGHKGSDRGVMVIIAVNDHKRRIEVGFGLEGILPDAKVGDIGRDMVPLLRANDFDGAMTMAVGQVAQVIAADAKVTLDEEPAPMPQASRHQRVGNPPIGLILFFIFFGFVIVFRIIVGIAHMLGFWRGWPPPRTGYSGGGYSGSGFFIGGGGGGGGGDGGGGGGGFGGFGGGDSGGGGAGGDW
jgi:uncharacterized protein